MRDLAASSISIHQYSELSVCTARIIMYYVNRILLFQPRKFVRDTGTIVSVATLRLVSIPGAEHGRGIFSRLVIIG